MTLTALLIAASICISGAARDKDLAPLYCPKRTAVRWKGKDGSELTAAGLPKGFAKTCLLMAERYLKRRNENLGIAAKVVEDLEKLLSDVENAKDHEAAKDTVRKNLEEMRDVALVKAEAALLEAVDREMKRLVMVGKALEAESKAERRLDGVDGDLVRRLLERHKSGDAEKAARTYIAGLKLVTSGILDYLDDDVVAAVAKMDQAARACPDLPVAFLYLGSFSVIVDQPDSAIEAWTRLLELQPNKKEVRQALKALGVKGISKPKKSAKKRHKRR